MGFYRSVPMPALVTLAIASITTVFANPIASQPPSTLEKRNVYCDGRLGGVKYSECHAAFLQIPQSEQPLFFMAQAGARPDEGLPYIWSVGECTIMAGLIHEHLEEMVRFVDIAFAARSIIEQCVSPSRIGGTAAEGVHSNFRVMIYQFDYGDEDTDRVGPDPTGVCAKKQPQKEDVRSCVLEQGVLTDFDSPLAG